MFDLKSKILIVDDASAMRVSMVIMLRKLGFSNFVEADGGVPALELIKSGKRFDLIFCDLQMPNGNGYDFLVQLRSMHDGRDIPFIIVTSETEASMAIKAINAGATGYVTKPVVVEMLQKAMQAAYNRIQNG